ncbi:hypothetical protein TNCV_4448361 [Trichonephila clavipes]|nr:hypothetical protein TNCV_4448361 [Trichonephila clavipes]
MGCQLRCHPRHLTMVQHDVAKSPRVAEQWAANIQSIHLVQMAKTVLKEHYKNLTLVINKINQVEKEGIFVDSNIRKLMKDKESETSKTTKEKEGIWLREWSAVAFQLPDGSELRRGGRGDRHTMGKPKYACPIVSCVTNVPSVGVCSNYKAFGTKPRFPLGVSKTFTPVVILITALSKLLDDNE